jgi:hypothetical protein
MRLLCARNRGYSVSATDTSNMREYLRIKVDVLGRPTDGYGRTAEACRAAATVAAAHAVAIRSATEAVRSGELELGRTGGNRLVRRLEVSAATFERLAERDDLFAEGLMERERHWSTRASR